MKKMTPREFKRYLEDEHHGEITLDYTDQAWHDMLGVVPDYVLTFQNADVRLAPTRLILSGQGKYLCFHGIDSIQAERGQDGRTRFLVHCLAALRDCSPGERTYVLRANTN